MSKIKSFIAKAGKEKRNTDEEVLAMNIRQDQRLLDIGIDPDSDPVEIMRQLREMREKRSS